MSRRIFSTDLDGKEVLAFDTGLDVRAFARARMAQFITVPGSIVFSNGEVETWLPAGVTELGPESGETMVIWGSLFPGERLSEILNGSGREDEALEALFFWLRARMIIEKSFAGNEPPFPGPAGAFIVMKEQQGRYPPGTVFFPPARLVRKSLEAEGNILEAERWVHPYLEGADAVSFSAGAMLYRIFCGALPFTADKEDELRRDIKEGVFTPPELAMPGLEKGMSDLINHAIRGKGDSGENLRRPAPDYISGFIGQVPPRPASSWIKPISEEETARINTEREQYSKKKNFEVKTRRFVIRNTAIIAASLICLVIVILSIRGVLRQRAEMPSTKGMTHLETAEAYYNAFNNLDHTMMSACVSGKAGKDDINSVMRLFVISKVRQAYEYQNFFMPAGEWLEAGRPATDKTVFGITDLKIRVNSINNENAGLEADFILWMSVETGEESEFLQPEGTIIRDRLNLTFRKGAWRITEIVRNQE